MLKHTKNTLRAAYQDMANDKEREAQALEWSEGVIKDASPHPKEECEG